MKTVRREYFIANILFSPFLFKKSKRNIPYFYFLVWPWKIHAEGYKQQMILPIIDHKPCQKIL
jgi:hypothetical protein